MTPPRHESGAVRLSDHDLEAMLERAAEEGARRALSDVGLGGKDAVVLLLHNAALAARMHPVRAADGGADCGPRHHHRCAGRAPCWHRDAAPVVRAEPMRRTFRSSLLFLRLSADS